MEFVLLILVGLVAGGLAKAIMGNNSGGCISTLILGLIGSFVGGSLGLLFLGPKAGGLLSPWTWLFAIGGSMLVLLIAQVVSGRRR
ncbi:MAG: GlsB/YeaQ/YmgE family stress response membrane protein [Micropruina sp.]|nr:GlsB/YeaQ/YmgE family stress response membrane protein [Micropruina sp.]